MKIFRSARKSFIDKGKLKKYLLYAFGEIILVMLGILLAFQVDRWNDNRINNKNALNYYQNIKNEITEDARILEGEISYNERYLKQFKTANHIISSDDRSKIDSLGGIIFSLTTYSDFDEEGNIYETMVNSGEIKLLKKREIIEYMRELQGQYNYINRMEKIHWQAIIQFAIPAMQQPLNFSTQKIVRPEMVYNYEFQNLLLSLVAIMEEKNTAYKDALSQIAQLNQILDKELKR